MKVLIHKNSLLFIVLIDSHYHKTNDIKYDNIYF